MNNRERERWRNFISFFLSQFIRIDEAKFLVLYLLAPHLCVYIYELESLSLCVCKGVCVCVYA